jgi:predicted unusual protein kinase regulating ubiquinone biosynthesis (AarF/ABC1/UbiB family)
MHFMKNMRHLYLLGRTLWVIFSECLLYTWFRDDSCFINRLTTNLASINILYVKAFQAVALNNNLISENLNNQLLRFTDNAPWSYDDIDFYTLVRVSDDFNLEFRDGFENPINSGMISLVFKVYKRETNQPLIVKIKRTHIDRKLEEAIDDLLYFVDLLSFIPFFKKYQIPQTIRNCADVISDQTKFNIEVNNMTKMKHNCSKLKYVRIPSAVQEVTDMYPNVIVMEYIEGVPIHKIDPSDYELFAKLVMKFGFVTSLMHGITHGDLHSGNILFIKDEKDNNITYKIGVIDFGIVYEIEEIYKNVLFQIFADLFTLSSHEIAEKIMTSGLIEPIEIIKHLPAHHYENIIKITSEIIESTIKEATQKQLYRFLSEFYCYLKDNEDISKLGLRPSDSFVKTQMCLAMAHGVTLTLCKDNCINIADKVLNDLFHMDFLSI